ncbi:Vesicle transport protein S20 [Geranomyces variabilis]|nr:Vesicle transport protein S20 [Geranomyces variabilis]
MQRTAVRNSRKPTAYQEEEPPTVSPHHAQPQLPPRSLPPHIQRQLDVLTRSELHLQTAVRELAEFAGPPLDVVARNDAIRGELKAILRGIEDIKLAADEEARPADTELILDRVVHHEHQHRQLQLALRAANLQTKQNAERRAAAEREELLRGGTDRRQARMAKMQDANSALQASSELTSSLSQALGMLSNEVEKSEEMTKALDDSTQVMQKTSNEYRTLSMAVRSSRQLITKLQRRDWTDRLLLLFGLLVFTLTVLSILRRRLWIWVPGWKKLTGQCAEGDFLCF